MPQNTVSWPKHKIKMPQKNPWKIYMWKQHATKIYFSPKTYQLQTFFRSKFYAFCFFAFSEIPELLGTHGH